MAIFLSRCDVARSTSLLYVIKKGFHPYVHFGHFLISALRKCRAMAEPCIDMILIMQNINKRESFLYPKSGCYKEWKDYIQKIDLQHCRFKRLYYCKL